MCSAPAGTGSLVAAATGARRGEWRSGRLGAGIVGVASDWPGSAREAFAVVDDGGALPRSSILTPQRLQNLACSRSSVPHFGQYIIAPCASLKLTVGRRMLNHTRK